MKEETQLPVTDEPVEVHGFRRVTDHLRGIYGIYLELTKKNRKIIVSCDLGPLHTRG
jgi:hypothetical protein